MAVALRPADPSREIYDTFPSAMQAYTAASLISLSVACQRMTEGEQGLKLYLLTILILMQLCLCPKKLYDA